MTLDKFQSSYLPDFDPDDVVESEVVEHDRASTERSVSRRVALQVLYEVDSTGHAVDKVIASHVDYQHITGKAASYLRRLVTGVLENKDRLDAVIQQYAPEWPLDQVAIVDRNILRMAIYEFGIESRTPLGVAIDEAVALARLFGAENAPRFVNGVLGALADEIDKIREILHIPDKDGE